MAGRTVNGCNPGADVWAGAGAFNVEGDFVEAPSQMLEEFFHDYGVLGSFAHHYQTGAVVPRALFDRWAKRQLPRV